MWGKFSNGMWRKIRCGLQSALAGLRDLFFVRECVVCGAVLDSGERHLCRSCLDDIPLTYFWSYSENGAMETVGGRCHVYNAAALFFYRHNSGYCEIVRRFKYGGDTALGLWAAHLLGDCLAKGGLYAGVQAVVPVPLHWRKRFIRGFNQAEIVARGVARRLGDLPVAPDLLRRRRYTATQTRKGAEQRGSNVSGAFALNKREAERLRSAGVRHILLVDDVVTTGATISECVRLLESFFTVSCAALGFVE